MSSVRHVIDKGSSIKDVRKSGGRGQQEVDTCGHIGEGVGSMRTTEDNGEGWGGGKKLAKSCRRLLLMAAKYRNEYYIVMIMYSSHTKDHYVTFHVLCAPILLMREKCFGSVRVNQTKLDNSHNTDDSLSHYANGKTYTVKISVKGRL